MRTVRKTTTNQNYKMQVTNGKTGKVVEYGQVCDSSMRTVRKTTMNQNYKMQVTESITATSQQLRL
jgi:hypothetical protein